MIWPSWDLSRLVDLFEVSLTKRGDVLKNSAAKSAPLLKKLTFSGSIRKTTLVGKQFFSPNIPWQNAKES